jgi:hypothetical protein
MIDPFVLLAPVLLLGVIGLLRFVGCDKVFRIDEVPPDSTHVVTFNDKPDGVTQARDPLTVPYKNLDFGNGTWMWLDTAASGGPNGITFNLGAPGPGTGDVTFQNGMRGLTSITVFPKSPGSITISDPSGTNMPITQALTSLMVDNPIPIKWQNIQSFRIQSDIGFDLILDTVVYSGDL